MKNGQGLLRSIPRAAVISLLAVIGASAGHAATYTWDPSGNRSDAAGSGNWDTTSLVWDNGTADVVWPNAFGSFSDTALFGGTDGMYTITVGSGVMGSVATFNASGYTFAGASATAPGTLMLFRELNVATGKTVTVGANMTLNSDSSAYINATSAAYAGAVVVNNGGKFGLNSTNIGGTFTIGANGTASGTTTSSTVVGGGTLNIDGANASLDVRGINISSGAVVNLNNGTLNAARSFGIYVNGGALNLNGGTYVAGYTPAGSAAGSTVRLNGAQIVNSTTGYGSYVGNSNTTVLVQAGGARFNVSSTWVVNVNSGLLHDSAGPAIDGGLVVNGTGNGTVTLSAAGTYNGGTTVSGGVLVVSANGALGTGDASVIATSVSLRIGTGVTNPFNNTLARLTLSGGGTANAADVGYLDLTSGANIAVGSLVLGTTTYSSGVFSSATFPEYFSGSGTLTVVPEPTSLACLCFLGVGGAVMLRRQACGARRA